MLTVCRWCAEEILFPIVAARGYCSGGLPGRRPHQPGGRRITRWFAVLDIRASARSRYVPANWRH